MGRSRAAGFTLIEVMVALLIMAVMATMAWQGIDALLRSREVSQGSLEASERLQTALAQWEQDLRLLQDSGVVQALAFDGTTLRFTRSAEQGLQVVGWSVRGGRLERWASPPTSTRAGLSEAWERSLQPLTAGDSRTLRVLDGLQGWQVYFYRGNSWSNAQSTGDEAAQPPSPTPSQPAASKLLPTGVRISLQFGPGAAHAGTLTRAVMLGPQP